MLAARPDVQYGCRQYIEPPVRDIQGINRALVLVRQDSEDVDIRLSSRLTGLNIRGCIPCSRFWHLEHDCRRFCLKPALYISAGLHFDFHPGRGLEIESCPFIASVSGGKSEGSSNDELRNSSARGVAKDIRRAPSPEVQQVKAKLHAITVKWFCTSLCSHLSCK